MTIKAFKKKFHSSPLKPNKKPTREWKRENTLSPVNNEVATVPSCKSWNTCQRPWDLDQIEGRLRADRHFLRREQGTHFPGSSWDSPERPGWQFFDCRDWAKDCELPPKTLRMSPQNRGGRAKGETVQGGPPARESSQGQGGVREGAAIVASLLSEPVAPEPFLWVTPTVGALKPDERCGQRKWEIWWPSVEDDRCINCPSLSPACVGHEQPAPFKASEQNLCIETGLRIESEEKEERNGKDSSQQQHDIAKLSPRAKFQRTASVLSRKWPSQRPRKKIA